jgi:DNA-binding CsgD family transcriptional regulator
MVIEAALARAGVARALGQEAIAQVAIAAAREAASDLAAPLTHARIALAEAQLGLGDGASFATAAGWPTAAEAPRWLAAALAALHRGDVAAAEALLERVQALSERRGSGWLLRRICIAHAQGAVARGDDRSVRVQLDAALAEVEAEEAPLAFLGAGEAIEMLLQVHATHPYRNTLPAIRAELASGRPPAVGDTGTWNAARAEALTPREQDVLRLIAAGASNAAIAQQLVLAVSTVKGYTHSLYGKLEASSRTEALARARARSLLPS